MFNFICGEVVSSEDGVVVLKCGDIGFELFVSDFTALDCQVGANVQLYTHLQVKEDGLTLYGFSTLQERKIFAQLITVSGIGCKMAIAVLSSVSACDLAKAIVTGDSKKLSAAKGIGKKTAERIILDLKEKIVVPVDVPHVSVSSQFSSEQMDAISVLCSLGISRGDAEDRVKNAAEAGLSKAEDILNFAFKNA